MHLGSLMEPQGDSKWRERVYRALCELKAIQEEGVLRGELARTQTAENPAESTPAE